MYKTRLARKLKMMGHPKGDLFIVLQHWLCELWSLCNKNLLKVLVSPADK